MASRLSNLACAICILALFSAVTSEDPAFPKIDDLEIEYYTTEAQVTDLIMHDTAYFTELYDGSEDRGKVEIIVGKMIKEVYYDNSTNEVLEVNATFCQKWETDDSIYSLEGTFFGFLNKKPLVIGPSAPFFYAQTRRKDIRYEKTETVRNIPCDKYTLDILTEQDNVTMHFYFAPKNWTTPYSFPGLRVPIRIHVIGETSKETEGRFPYPVEVVTDFAYFKPTIDDRTELQPPVGLGCLGREKTNTFPEGNSQFQYTAEVVDLVYESEHTDVDARHERVWFDEENKIGRFDIYKRTTSSRTFQDFNTGVMFEFTKGYDCKVVPLKNSFFEKYDVDMLGSMKTAQEVLNFDGDFYEMGQNKVRGLTCDTYESVRKNFFYKQQLDRFVVTAYFSEDYTNVGVDGEEESRIPVAVMLTGWKSPTELAFKLRYNIFAFDDMIWPEMYSTFDLEKCYTKAESKTYFALIVTATPKDAALMEMQDELVVRVLRSQVAKYAVVPEWRIPFLKVDYKPTGVYATGLMLERPPALLQFYEFQTGESKTKDKFLKMADAATLEDCANSCIDEGDFPCKGFYFCNTVCFLKSDDPTATYGKDDQERVLGVCSEYIRAEKDSTNFHNIPLAKSLQNLENAVLNRSIAIEFEIEGGEEIIKVSDIVIGEGPYTGVDTADKPYKVNVQFRKLDSSLTAAKAIKGVEMVNDCYKKCFEAGSACASFSFCGRSSETEKECIISSDLVTRGKTNDLQLIPTGECDIYDLRYVEYFTKYPEHVSYLPGYRVDTRVETLEECAKNCRLEDKGKCRGFEYCKEMKTCSLHTKHILDLKTGDSGTGKTPCVHYAARFIADYKNLGFVLVDDKNNVRYEISLEECARVCSEELGDSCRSFNFCPASGSGGSCALSGKTLTTEGVTTTENNKCTHYEKRDGVQDWGSTNKVKTSGYTSKGFTGLVVGMLALGLIIGALGFVGYSYWRSKRSGEGLSVRFMKQET